LGKKKFLKKKIRLFEDATNFGFFFLCHPWGTQGFPKKVCPFGPAIWPAIANNYTMNLYEQRAFLFRYISLKIKHWGVFKNYAYFWGKQIKKKINTPEYD